MLLLILFLGLFFLLKSFKFLNSKNDYTARKMLLFSYIYLPIVQILYVIDKFFITMNQKKYNKLITAVSVLIPLVVALFTFS